MHEPNRIVSPALTERLASESDGRTNAITVGAETVCGLFDDQVGVCLNCGALADPVPNEATGQTCEACGKPCLVGINLALEIGAIRVDSEFAA